MISLNLISPEQQNNLRLKYWQTMIKNVVGLMLIGAVVLAILLLPVREQLNQQEAINITLKTLALAKNREITAKINSLNAAIGDLVKIKNRLYRFSATLSELAKLTPASVALLEFNASAENNAFTLKGFAKTRDALIAFQNGLLASGFFAKVQSPLENYLQQDEVTWQISGQLTK